MLALFKGELSLEDMTRRMTYKEMISLRDARVNRLMKENKEAERTNNVSEASIDNIKEKLQQAAPMMDF